MPYREVDITSTNITVTSNINLPFGHWFCTQPMTVIIADNGVKLEASALSPRFGVKTDTAASGMIGNSPVSVRMYDTNWVFGLEDGGIAYKRGFLDENARKLSLQDLEFLVH